MATGDNLTYVAGASGRPIPLATDQRIRPTHTPTRPKPTGLDWDAITPTCSSCGAKSGQLAEVPGKGSCCPTCRGVKPAKATKGQKGRRTGYAAVELPEDELLRRFTAPDDTRLGEELADLEATDPAVAAAAEKLDDATRRIARPEDHVKAPREEATPAPEPEAATVTHLATAYTHQANLDAQVAHAERVLRATHGTTDPVTRLLRLNAITAIEALHLHTEVHTKTPVEPNPPGLGGTTRPAARTQGEGTARPVTGGIRVRDTELRNRMHDLRATPRQIKTWAVAQGLLPELIRGRVPRHIVDAYEAAHQTPSTTHTSDGTWRVDVDPEPEGLIYETPSGRTWDRSRRLWVDPPPRCDSHTLKGTRCTNRGYYRLPDGRRACGHHDRDLFIEAPPSENPTPPGEESE